MSRDKLFPHSVSLKFLKLGLILTLSLLSFLLFTFIIAINLDIVKVHADITTGLVGHWKMDDNFNDSSLNNLTSSDYGDITFGPGQIDRAAYFTKDATEDYISISNQTILDIQDEITISAWVKPGGGNAWAPVISKWDSDEQFLGYDLSANYYIDKWFCTFGGVSAISSNTLIDEGNWQHVACTWDGSTMKIYINGDEDATITVSGQIDISTVALEIGRNIDEDDGYHHLFEGA